jgi:uncharacterized membrane protein YcaP (DUF421 family)
MDAVLRGAAIYLLLLVIFRISGQRSLSSITTFDFVLLLIIGEATQQALLGEDFSFTHAMIVIVTLVGLDILLSLIKQRSPTVERWIDGLPLIVVKDGRVLHERLDKVRVDEADVMTAARELHGLERLDQIKYAVLERSGSVSIIPK